MKHIKKSFGIICINKHKTKGLQILLVKKNVSYYFCEFVFGHYKKSDDNHLKKLFNNMTFHEKMDILSMRYEIMWYRIYKTYQQNSSTSYFANLNDIKTQSAQPNKLYIKKKAKFETCFMGDGGIKLKKLMNSTTNGETIWEIPKGRIDEKDGNLINSAIREFTEETGVDPEKYEILYHMDSYIESYKDFNTTYKNEYFFANAPADYLPSIKFNDEHQISEVSDMNWCTINDLKNMKLDTKTHNRLIKSFEKIIKKYKNYVKKSSNISSFC